MHKQIILLIAMLLATPVAVCAGEFKPYEIKAGVSYYSNEYSSNNGLSELGEEKNLEEVYQNYNYYEAIFDTQERIVTFNAYKQGSIEFSETYYYDKDGQPEKKHIKKADGSTSVEML
jgi:hypothetical protein